MGKNIYIIPEVDVYTMKGIRLLDNYSENPNGSPVVNDTELDANGGTFEEEIVSTKGPNLWEE